MTPPAAPPRPAADGSHPRPADIVFATDLSHRCDRAFERVLRLARAWQARLLIVHVLPPEPTGTATGEAPDWYRPADAGHAARARIYDDLARGDPQIDFLVRTCPTGDGPPADAVLETATTAAAGLIVTGIESSRGWTRHFGGGSNDRLIRRAPVPVLMVRDRVADDYADLLVTTDLSAPSQAALATAHGWFPAARVTLFHAYDVPYGLLVDRERITQQFRAEREAQARRFLRDAGLPAIAAETARCIVEYGSPDGLLRHYHSEFPHHLTVIGSSGGGRVYETLVGSTGRRIADAVPGDVLFIPPAAILRPQSG